MATSIEDLITRFNHLQIDYNLTTSTVTKEALLKIVEDMKSLNIMAYIVYKRKCKHLGLI